MPDLIIDSMAIKVPEGTRVIDAAEKLGIMIPRFCYLKVLGAVGACRMCAVHFVAGPLKGVEMSCMVEAEDGMVVSTSDPEAVDFRRQVIEWLMANHPHDCPVCDEGGQCLLQDETVAGGHGIRCYPGRKRTYRDQYLGPFIQHEMNRCIHCYRCARFYQEYAGFRDFGVLQIGNRIFYGRFADGPLESPFAGNLVDICPTGVFTDKPARYRARRWDMQRAPSVCIHCAIGCNTVASSFHREIIRQEARENSEVNGSFICDRGRFGCFYANHPERPWRPRVDNSEADRDHALAAAAGRMQGILDRYGPQALAVIGSPRASLETMFMLEQTCRVLGTGSPQFFTDPLLASRVRRAVARLDDRLAVSLDHIEKGDCILVLGVDPVNEAPMLTLALRQAARKGATIAVIDPRPVSLPFEFSLLSAAPAELSAIAGVLAHRALARQDVSALTEQARRFRDSLDIGHVSGTVDDDTTSGIAAKISACKHPIIICGTAIVHETMPDFAANLAQLLCDTMGRCGLYYVLPGPNGFGAVLSDEPAAMSFPGLLEAIAREEIKGLVAVETDPFHSFCDRQRLEGALAKLEVCICLDYLPTELSRQAHVFMPTTTHFETGSSFVNQEGRLQYAAPVHHGGRPLSRITAGKHPQRDFTRDSDGFDPRPAWQILQLLGARVLRGQGEADQGPSRPPEEIHSLLRQQLRQRGYSPDRNRLLRKAGGVGYRFPSAGRSGRTPDQSAMELILTELTFGTEELSSFSGPVIRAIREPAVIMHTEDAAEAGLNNGDTVTMHLDRGILQLRLTTSVMMARGCIVLPRHRALAWQQLKYQQEMLPGCRIEKA